MINDDIRLELIINILLVMARNTKGLNVSDRKILRDVERLLEDE